MVRDFASKSPADETRRDTQLKLVLLGVALLLVVGYALSVTSMGESTVEGGIAVLHSDTALLFIGIAGALSAFCGFAFLLLRGRFRKAAVSAPDVATVIANLAGRKGFLRALAAELDEGAKTSRQLAVHLIDIDRFRLINEVRGEEEGNAFLRLITERLLVLVNRSERLARIGDDEFAIIQPEAGGIRHAEIFANRIQETVKDACAQVPRNARPGVSIGTAVAPDRGSTAHKLMHSAALALQAAKKSGGGAVRVYTREMDAAVEARLQIEAAISEGLHNGWFELHFQPNYNLRTRRLTGFEALVRMNHPKRGQLAPAAFLSIADESGLIHPLGDWIIREAVATAANWPSHLVLSINLSLAQFRHGDVANMIINVLSNAGVSGSRLRVEIPEAVLRTGLDPVGKQLRRLRGRGVAIVVDDFGVDDSRLALFSKSACDAVKLDLPLLERVGKDRDAENLVRGLIATARAFQLEILAEGVERAAQAHFLMSHDCQKVQGFLFGRPTPASELAAIIAKDLRNATGEGQSKPRSSSEAA
jgi:diguanylate cyclase (GGDEF)-like protein